MSGRNALASSLLAAALIGGAPDAARAEAARIPQELNVKAIVSKDQTMVRLGSIHVEPPPRITSSE